MKKRNYYNKTIMKIITHIDESMQTTRLYPAKMSRDLKMNQTVISKICKRLRDKGLLTMTQKDRHKLHQVSPKGSQYLVNIKHLLQITEVYEVSRDKTIKILKELWKEDEVKP